MSVSCELIKVEAPESSSQPFGGWRAWSARAGSAAGRSSRRVEHERTEKASARHSKPERSTSGSRSCGAKSRARSAWAGNSCSGRCKIEYGMGDGRCTDAEPCVDACMSNSMKHVWTSAWLMSCRRWGGRRCFSRRCNRGSNWKRKWPKSKVRATRAGAEQVGETTWIWEPKIVVREVLERERGQVRANRKMTQN